VSYRIPSIRILWRTTRLSQFTREADFYGGLSTNAYPTLVFDELSIAGFKAGGIDFEAVFSGAPERWISLPLLAAHAHTHLWLAGPALATGKKFDRLNDPERREVKP
jgi:hypothetical protein